MIWKSRFHVREAHPSAILIPAIPRTPMDPQAVVWCRLEFDLSHIGHGVVRFLILWGLTSTVYSPFPRLSRFLIFLDCVRCFRHWSSEVIFGVLDHWDPHAESAMLNIDIDAEWHPFRALICAAAHVPPIVAQVIFLFRVMRRRSRTRWFAMALTTSTELCFTSVADRVRMYCIFMQIDVNWCILMYIDVLYIYV